jgi:hypothetical protein
MTATIDREEIRALLDAGEPIVLLETLRPEHFDQATCRGRSTCTTRRWRSAPPRSSPIAMR